MITIQTAVMLAALSAMLTGAIVWGRTAQKIDDLCKLVEKLSDQVTTMVLDVERLKWHTGQHPRFQSPESEG